MDSDSLMELTELVHKGERRGIFMDDMPARIHQNIQAENLTFVKNRDVYNTEYFKFVRDLAAKNCVCSILKLYKSHFKCMFVSPDSIPLGLHIEINSVVLNCHNYFVPLIFKFFICVILVISSTKKQTLLFLHIYVRANRWHMFS